MAKLKAAGKSKAKAKDARGAIPCLIVILSGFTLIFLLLYLVLRSSV